MKKRSRLALLCLLLLGALTACDTSGQGTGSTGTGSDPGGDTSPINTVTPAP